MNRRAFLLLRTRGRERVLELSCQRLYVRWADARARAGAAVAAGTEGAAGTEVAGLQNAWGGEPPTELVVPTVEQILGELERGLAEADVLRVAETEWLSDPSFRGVIEPRVAAFREAGGRVE